MGRLSASAMLGGLQAAAASEREVRPERLPSARRQARKSILVAIVADSSVPTRRRMLTGMRRVDGTRTLHQLTMHWAVCAYDDGADAWAPTVLEAESLPSARLVKVVNASAHDRKPITVLQRKARTAHHRKVVAAVWAERGFAYDAVWLPDADLLFESFDLPEFLHRWLCTFAGGAPVVAQPVVRPGTQVWPFNLHSWRNCTSPRSRARAPPLASAARTQWLKRRDDEQQRSGCFWRRRWGPEPTALRISFIENQAALVDAQFLRWFFGLELVAEFARLQLRYGVEWGPDSVWCRAAEWWLAAQNVSRTPCAVLMVPIEHANTKSLADSKGGSHANHGFRLMHRAGLREHLARCKGAQCRKHPWFGYQPAPGWRPPASARGIAQVRACATSAPAREECAARTRKHALASVLHAAGPRRGEPPPVGPPPHVFNRSTLTWQAPDGAPLVVPPARAAGAACDGLVELYWREGGGLWQRTPANV